MIENNLMATPSPYHEKNQLPQQQKAKDKGKTLKKERK